MQTEKTKESKRMPGCLVFIIRLIFFFLIIVILLVAGLFFYFNKINEKNDFSIKFVRAYTLLNSATNNYFKKNGNKAGKLLNKPFGAIELYAPYFDIKTKNTLGFVTDENIAYAFVSTNTNCSSVPDTLDKKNVKTACAKVLIDINNTGKPNKFSTKEVPADRFTLYLYQNGLIALNSSYEDELTGNLKNVYEPVMRKPSGNADNEKMFEYTFKKVYADLDIIIKQFNGDGQKNITVDFNNKMSLLTYLIKNFKIKEFKENSFLTQDGILYNVALLNSSCPEIPKHTKGNDACAMVTIDVNGYTGPNTLTGTGKVSDKFVIYIYNNGITTKSGSEEEKILQNN